MHFLNYADLLMSGEMPSIGPSIPSKLNFHTSIWVLLELHEESTSCDSRKKIFGESILMMPSIDPEDLYNLLINFLPDYEVDEDSVYVYAEKIASFNKEEVYAR